MTRPLSAHELADLTFGPCTDPSCPSAALAREIEAATGDGEPDALPGAG